MDPELRAYLEQQFAAINQRFAAIDHRFAAIDQRFTDLRRHFDVVAEAMMAKVELVGEGVRTVDHKLDRFAVETRGNFERVDHRFLHLTAQIHRQ